MHAVKTLLVNRLVVGVLLAAITVWVAVYPPPMLTRLLQLAVLAGVAALGFVVLLRGIVKWPYLPVLAIMLYMPFRPLLTEDVAGAKYVSEGILILLILALALAVLPDIIRTQKLVLVKTPIDRAALCFVLVGIASIALNAVDPVAGLAGLRAVLQFVVLYYVVVNLRLSKDKIRIIVMVLLCVAAFEALLAVSESVRQGRFVTQASATLGNYNALGVYLGFAFMLVIGFVSVVNRYRVLLFVVIAAFMLALLVTYSREAWVGALAGYFAIALVRKRISHKFLLVVWVLVGLMLAILVVRPQVGLADDIYANLNPLQRALGMFLPRYISESAEGGRLYYATQGLRVLADHSLLGVGPGRFGGSVSTQYARSDIYDEYDITTYMGQIDNGWMTVAVETGVLGLGAFSLMLLALFRSSIRIFSQTKDRFLKGLSLGYVGAMVGVVLQAFVAPIFELQPISSLLWVFGALVISYRQAEIRQEACPERIETSPPTDSERQTDSE